MARNYWLMLLSCNFPTLAFKGHSYATAHSLDLWGVCSTWCAADRPGSIDTLWILRAQSTQVLGVSKSACLNVSSTSSAWVFEAELSAFRSIWQITQTMGQETQTASTVIPEVIDVGIGWPASHSAMGGSCSPHRACMYITYAVMSTLGSALSLCNQFFHTAVTAELLNCWPAILSFPVQGRVVAETYSVKDNKSRSEHWSYS